MKGLRSSEVLVRKASQGRLSDITKRVNGEEGSPGRTSQTKAEGWGNM